MGKCQAKRTEEGSLLRIMRLLRSLASLSEESRITQRGISRLSARNLASPSEESRGLFGHGNIDVHARSHLEPGGGGEPGDDLKVPVVVIFLLIPDGSSADHVVEIRVVQLGVEPEQGLSEDLR